MPPVLTTLVAAAKPVGFMVFLFLEKKLKALSYVALPRLFPSLIISGPAPKESEQGFLREG